MKALRNDGVDLFHLFRDGVNGERGAVSFDGGGWHEVVTGQEKI